MNGLDGPALDRYITGSYGADQYADVYPCRECGDDGYYEDHDGSPVFLHCENDDEDCLGWDFGIFDRT